MTKVKKKKKKASFNNYYQKKGNWFHIVMNFRI